VDFRAMDVPEPSIFALLGLGLCGTGVMKVRGRFREIKAMIAGATNRNFTGADKRLTAASKQSANDNGFHNPEEVHSGRVSLRGVHPVCDQRHGRVGASDDLDAATRDCSGQVRSHSQKLLELFSGASPRVPRWPQFSRAKGVIHGVGWRASNVCCNACPADFINSSTRELVV